MQGEDPVLAAAVMRAAGECVNPSISKTCGRGGRHISACLRWGRMSLADALACLSAILMRILVGCWLHLSAGSEAETLPITGLTTAKGLHMT